MKMLMLFLVTFNAFASVLPERVVTPPLDLFSARNKVLPNGDREIKVTTVTKKGEFSQNGSKTVISKDRYAEFLKLAMPVLESVPQVNDGPRGTAFHIGHNLVLTNNHVLDVTFKNTTECGGFRLKNHEGDIFNCKKVHFCNPEEDVCLIEMKSAYRGLFKKIEVNLTSGPSHKIRNYYSPSRNWDEEILTAIGNSAGFGIHLSQGKGVRFVQRNIYFYAPITNGNSGGALLNEEGLVVGIVKRQSHTVIGSDSNLIYNVALSAEHAIDMIRDALQDNLEILEKFNQSVVE